MHPTTRIAAVIAATAVALVTAYGTVQDTVRAALAPTGHRTAAAVPRDEHDPKEDVELDENGRPDLNED
ncbi:hypothetical protein ACH41H_11565 [Streptomyces sp. NPDC020800]|uniref:hypothetical protein n=1 Tax=Streptomyces sp. NPDC020800 TaxID=3365092 RepID=UPI0037ABA97B